MEQLKQMLKLESVRIPPDEIIDEFLSAGEELTLGASQALIEIGDFAPDVYVLKSGFMQKSVNLHGEEMIEGFANPGTIIFCYDSYLMGRTSVMKLSACCECKLLRIKAEKFNSMLESSHEFALWFLSIAHFQLYSYDYKSSIVQGDALTRYNQMVKARPDIMQYVPLKSIASYLGITRQHLSRIRSYIRKKNQ